MERPCATFFVPKDNRTWKKNDNKLITHTMQCVVGIQKLEVICDVVFDLLLEVMCNFYFETYKYVHNVIVV